MLDRIIIQNLHKITTHGDLQAINIIFSEETCYFIDLDEEHDGNTLQDVATVLPWIMLGNIAYMDTFFSVYKIDWFKARDFFRLMKQYVGEVLEEKVVFQEFLEAHRSKLQQVYDYPEKDFLAVIEKYK